jgi:hypothetical protein
MSHAKTMLVFGALCVGAVTFASPGSASPLGAQTLNGLTNAVAAQSPIVQVRHRRRNVGAAIAAGAFFGILGGIIAAQAEPRYYYYRGPGYYYGPPAPFYDSAVAYCMRRFRSYDPYSGTYLGYDGYRHPCP